MVVVVFKKYGGYAIKKMIMNGLQIYAIEHKMEQDVPTA